MDWIPPRPIDIADGFVPIDYEVCVYCTHMEMTSRGSSGDFQYCGISPVESETNWYKQVDILQAPDKHRVNGLKGCEKFEACGMPAHPDIRSVLIENNPLAVTIPEDPNATESSYDLLRKRIPYLEPDT